MKAMAQRIKHFEEALFAIKEITKESSAYTDEAKIHHIAHKALGDSESFPNKQEREYPLRKGSLIRTEEGVLFSRASANSIPLLTSPEVEIDGLLEAYGDALESLRYEKVQSSGWEGEYKKLVAEQDKEIQRYKTDVEYLQKVIDAKDEMLAWAERLMGSGPVPGIHYDPTNWLMEYRSLKYMDGGNVNA